MGRNGELDSSVDIIVTVSVVGNPHIATLLSVLVLFQWEEARLIKINKMVNSILLIWNEEIKTYNENVRANTRYVHIKLEAPKGNSRDSYTYIWLWKVQREYIWRKP